MKKQPSSNTFFLLPFFVLFFISCSNNDGADIPTATENIVQLAVANANLSTLVTALQRTDLVSALEGNGPFTVLAPTNAAFNTFFIANGFSGVDQVPVELLKQILLNHVLGATIRSSDFAGFQSGYAKTLANGISTGTKISLYFDANQGITFNGVSEVTSGGANLILTNVKT